jgi:hypothetical protein
MIRLSSLMVLPPPNLRPIKNTEDVKVSTPMIAATNSFTLETLIPKDSNDIAEILPTRLLDRSHGREPGKRIST